MPGELMRVYWDSCVFLALLKLEEDRVHTLISAMDAASHKRDLVIITSVLSVTEVAHAVREDVDMQEEELDRLWGDPGILLVEVNRLTALEARSLVRQARAANRRLTPPDAIHLATAKRAQAGEIHTYDESLLTLGSIAELNIVEPYAPQLLLPIEEER